MSNPIISVISSAIRIQYWLEMYDKFTQHNKIPFEMVFVGSVRPTFSLPPNFIHIYSEDSVVKCFETACRNAKGEYVFMTADDYLHEPFSALDIMYGYAIRLDDKAVVMARYAEHNCDPNDSVLTFMIRLPLSPITGSCTLIKRSVWQELGGLDRRFHSFRADTDLHMRIYEAGGHPFIVPNCVTRERQHLEDQGQLRLTVREKDVFEIDQGKIQLLWLNQDNTIISRKRSAEVTPFSDEEISIIR